MPSIELSSLDIILICVIQGVVCGGFCGTLASSKGRHSGAWFLAGFFFGPIGLIAAAGLPSKKAEAFFLTRKCGACAEAVRLESKKCRHCGEPCTPQDADDAIRACIRKDDQHRMAALAVMKALPRDSQEMHLIAMLELRDSDHFIPFRAAEMLVELGTPAGLVAAFRSGYSTSAAMAKLKALHDPNLIPVFREALESDYLRYHAIEGLASFGREALEAVIAQGDSSRSLRKAIKEHLERL